MSMIKAYDFVLSSSDMELIVRSLSDRWKMLPDDSEEKEKLEDLLKQLACVVLADYDNQPGGAFGGVC